MPAAGRRRRIGPGRCDQGRNQIRCDVTGPDPVDPDAAVGPLDGEDLGQRDRARVVNEHVERTRGRGKPAERIRDTVDVADRHMHHVDGDVRAPVGASTSPL
ncbi:hypothetical protein CIW52_18590 [Mycolicibacterium sp. P9-64]|nr:hypothetical protein CIW52_18590 [Mycolicibacterium sp. P9-64]